MPQATINPEFIQATEPREGASDVTRPAINPEFIQAMEPREGASDVTRPAINPEFIQAMEPREGASDVTRATIDDDNIRRSAYAYAIPWIVLDGADSAATRCGVGSFHNPIAKRGVPSAEEMDGAGFDLVGTNWVHKDYAGGDPDRREMPETVRYCVILPGGEVDPGGRAVNSILAGHVGPGGSVLWSVVAPGASITGTLVGSYCGSAAVAGLAVRSLIGDDVVVGRGTVLYPGFVVERGVRIGERVSLGEGGAFSGGYDFPLFSRVAWSPWNDKLPRVLRVALGSNGRVCEDATVGDDSRADRWVKVGKHVVIGADVVVCSGARVSDSSVIGDGVRIGSYAAIGKHVTVASGGVVGPSAKVGDSSVIGDGVRIGSYVAIGKYVTVASGAELCAAATVMQWSIIGERACIDEYSLLGPGNSVGAGTYVGPRTATGALVHIGAGVKVRGWSMFGDWSFIGDGSLVGCVNVGRWYFMEGPAIENDGTLRGGYAGDGLLAGAHVRLARGASFMGEQTIRRDSYVGPRSVLREQVHTEPGTVIYEDREFFGPFTLRGGKTRPDAGCASAGPLWDASDRTPVFGDGGVYDSLTPVEQRAVQTFLEGPEAVQPSDRVEDSAGGQSVSGIGDGQMAYATGDDGTPYATADDRRRTRGKKAQRRARRQGAEEEGAGREMAARASRAQEKREWGSNVDLDGDPDVEADVVLATAEREAAFG